MRKSIIILFLINVILGGVFIYLFFMRVDSTKNFQEVVQENMGKAHIPGLGLGIIKEGEWIFNYSFGYQNIEQNIKVTEKTIFTIASISKLITGTAAMQLVEQGQLNLDVSINEYLDFEVKHPKYPEIDITLRMLLTHTSGFDDGYEPYENLYTIENGGGDSDISLKEFVRGYFIEGGDYYNVEENFHSFKPGKDSEYANSNFTLLGYIVEKVSGQDFVQYVKQNIFVPLQMENSSWFLKDTEISQLAVPYNNEGKNYKPYPHYAHPSYPDGFVRTTVEDLSRFFIAFMNGGVYKDQRILSEKNVKLMLEPQVINGKTYDGLAWDICAYERDGQSCDEGLIVPGHNGGDHGVSSLAFFYPENKKGIILLMNADIRNDEEPQDNKYIRNIIEAALKQ